jgi:hypothetical protein
MCAALPRSKYYGGSVPSAPSAGVAPIPAQPAGRRPWRGTHADGSRVHCRPVNGLGTQLCPCGIATATAAANSPWPPDPGSGNPARSSPPIMRSGCAPPSSPYPPDLSWRSFKRRNAAGFSRIPSRLAHRARPVRQYRADATLSRLLPPSPATPGSGCLQLHPTAATARRWAVFHLHPQRQRLAAHPEADHDVPARPRRVRKRMAARRHCAQSAQATPAPRGRLTVKRPHPSSQGSRSPMTAASPPVSAFQDPQPAPPHSFVRQAGLYIAVVMTNARICRRPHVFTMRVRDMKASQAGLVPRTAHSNPSARGAGALLALRLVLERKLKLGPVGDRPALVQVNVLLDDLSYPEIAECPGGSPDCLRCRVFP